MLITEESSNVAAGMNIPVPLLQLLENVAPNRRRALSNRLMTQLPAMRERLERIYGHRPEFETWFVQLLKNTLALAIERPEALWQLDARRATKSNSALPGLGYCAYVDKFAGDLAGVQKHIPYLKSLGITYLHLLPFLKAGNFPNDGGFAVAAFDEISPDLGTMDQLAALTHALRDAGISLCSDLVLNHVSHDHLWAKKARAGDPIFKEYFHWLPSADAVQAREATLSQVFPATAPGNFTYIDDQKAWVWSTFYPYQWDLNYSNPAVFAEIATALLRLANQGVEAFRLDSAGYLWKRDGTNCLNQPEVHFVLQALRCVVELAAPAVLLKAEAIMPTGDLPPYFGMQDDGAPECHVAYHSSLMAASWAALAEGKVAVLEQVLANTPALPDACTWMTYVRCHDDIGWNVLKPELAQLDADASERLGYVSRFFSSQDSASYAQGASFQATSPGAVHGTNGMTASLVGLHNANDNVQREQAAKRMLLLYALSLFVGGLPLIYMGDELGQANLDENQLKARPGTDGRELQRPSFDWSQVAADGVTLKAPNPIYSGLALLIARRNAELRKIADLPIRVVPAGNASVLLLSKGSEHFGIFNFSGQAQQLHGVLQHLGNPVVTFENLLNGDQLDFDKLPVAPYEVLWLKRCTG